MEQMKLNEFKTEVENLKKDFVQMLCMASVVINDLSKHTVLLKQLVESKDHLEETLNRLEKTLIDETVEEII